MKFTIKGDEVRISPKKYKKGEARIHNGKLLIVRTPGNIIEFQVVGTVIKKLAAIKTNYDDEILQKINQYHVPSKINQKKYDK
jgi:hypothetical protein